MHGKRGDDIKKKKTDKLAQSGKRLKLFIGEVNFPPLLFHPFVNVPSGGREHLHT